MNKELLIKTLHNLADSIDARHSDYTESELDEILEDINKVTNTRNKLSKYQAARYLGISVSTFNNRVRSGEYPEGRKEPGFKEKFWLKSDLC